VKDDKKNDGSNIFVAKSIYPEAAQIFTFRLRPLKDVKDDCYIVLDTNVLLAPYTIGREDLLDQCRRTYKPLVTAKRLVIPGQVAREFAKNRTAKLAELHQQLSRKKQVQQLQKGKYPLLSSIREYAKVLQLEEEIDRKLREYQKAVDRVIAHIQAWQWDDPVSLMYSEIFTEETILDLSINEEDVIRDLDRRHLYGIPPGYKDRGKNDEGVGDLIIWYTILEIGKSHKKSVLFVSGEEKADWYQKSEGQPLYLRYELIDEFRRHSEGQSFHIVKFSNFLELYGASEELVDRVRKAEEEISKDKTKLTTKEIQASFNELLSLDGVISDMLKEFYSFKNDQSISWTDLGRTSIFTSQQGTKIGYLVTSLEPPFSFEDILKQRRSSLRIIKERMLDKFIIFISFPDPDAAELMAYQIQKNIAVLDEFSYVLGYIAQETDEFTICRTIPHDLFKD
jgi:rRNA-processing protein FCF1